MPTIHFDYLMGSAAIDFSSLLAISIGIVAEMRRNHQPHRRMTNRRAQSPPGHQTLTIRDRTWRERSDWAAIRQRSDEVELAAGRQPPSQARGGSNMRSTTHSVGPPRR